MKLPARHGVRWALIRSLRSLAKVTSFRIQAFERDIVPLASPQLIEGDSYRYSHRPGRESTAATKCIQTFDNPKQCDLGYILDKGGIRLLLSRQARPEPANQDRAQLPNRSILIWSIGSEALEPIVV